jgi:hypothetical protein
MRRLSTWFNLSLGLVLIGFTAEQVLAPTSWWIEVHKVYVPDFSIGDPSPIVGIDDTIHKAFVARYFIEIRKVGISADDPAGGGKPDPTRFSYFCSGEGELSFRPGVDPAASLNLAWWTRNQCPKFDLGSYYAQIIIEWRDFLADRSITVQSNVWSVTLPEPVLPADATASEASPATPPPPPKIIVQKPVIVEKVVRPIIRRAAKCEPSLIPPRACPEPRQPRRSSSGR